MLRLKLVGVALLAALALPAYAVHEATNLFDMTDVIGGDADATGRSVFISGGGNGTFWDNQIDATGLDAFTHYSWVGIAAGTASEICSFTTDADGAGGCRSDVNSRLGMTEVRLGGVNGPTELQAVSSIDEDGRVEDGEIERKGGQRFSD